MKRVLRLLIVASVAIMALILNGCTAAPNENEAAANRTQSQPGQPQPGPPQAETKPLTGSIKVGSRPGEADILLIAEDDGGADPPQPRGKTPAIITELPPGKYAVHLEKPGYKPFQKSVEVKAGETTTVTTALQKR